MPSEICFCIVPSPKPSARRAGSHGQWGAGDRPRSRWSIGHCEKTGYLEGPNDVNRFVQRVPQILSDPDLHHRPPIFPRHYLGEDQSACRRATGGCPEGAAATARAATEATTSLLPSRSSPPPLWAEQLRLHAAMGLIWIRVITRLSLPPEGFFPSYESLKDAAYKHAKPAGWAGKGSKWACGKRVKYLLDLQARLQTRQEDDA
ncbi:hypothetical protein V8E54_009269 [Elaphomyces granulatus]